MASRTAACTALIHAFSSTFDVDFRPAVADAAEVLLATRLRAWKYDSWAWTIDGRAGERERRWGPPLLDAR